MHLTANQGTKIHTLLPGLTTLWQHSMGHPDVCIAVLDGPVDMSHACFEGANLKQVATLVGAQAGQDEATRHGTHIVSLIFGQPDSPVPGIAPACRGLILPIFASDKAGRILPCSQLDLARAITQAVELGAHVINVSGGELQASGEPEPFLAEAVRLCADRGVLLVAAVGNDGCQCLHVPAAAPSALAVGGLDKEGQPLAASNWGLAYQSQGILAPGTDIQGALPGGGVVARSGTSFATALVSGVAALLLSVQHQQGQPLSPPAVHKALLESALACDPHEALDCRRYLVGTLNIQGAYALIQEGGIIPMADDSHISQPIDEAETVLVAAAGLEAEADVPDSVAVESAATPEGTVSPEAETAATVPLLADVEPTQEPAMMTVAPQPVATMPASVVEAVTDEVTAASLATAVEAPVEASVEPVVAVVPTASPPAPQAMVAPAAQVLPAGCGGEPPALVYALGKLGYDFINEARRDSFIQAGLTNPHDHSQFLSYLEVHPYVAESVTWTLTLEGTPIYALSPGGAYASTVYYRLREFLQAQLTEGVERISVPGYTGGKARLFSGQEVPLIRPDLRGMFNWSTRDLATAVLGQPGGDETEQAQYQQQWLSISNFLDRIYYELRNLGLTSAERAMNFAATNAFQAGQIFQTALSEQMMLDKISVEKSPICRPGSDCLDVTLAFFNPNSRSEQARKVYRFCVDVSDVIPVTIGAIRAWHVY